MTDKKQQNDIPHENTFKDPDEWTTGDEPMTGAQRSYLKTLSDEAGLVALGYPPSEALGPPVSTAAALAMAA